MSERGNIVAIQLLGSDCGDGMELSKRTYFPCIVKAKCPTCDEVVEMNMTEHYLSHPGVDCIEELSMVCDSDHEFHVDVIVRLSLEAAPTDDGDDTE